MCVGCWHSSLLHLADDVGRDGRVEVDGVVSKPLRAFVTFTTPALKGLTNADLSAVAVLGVVLDTIHILQKRKAQKRQSASIHYRYSHHLIQEKCINSLKRFEVILD